MKKKRYMNISKLKKALKAYPFITTVLGIGCIILNLVTVEVNHNIWK